MTWIFWGIAIAVGAAFSLFMHEASHAVVVMLRGGKMLQFKPYPNKDASGRWWFGRVQYQFTSDFRDTKWRHGSPLLVAVPLAIIWSVLALFVCQYLWAFAAWSVIDFAWWWRGYFGLARENRIRGLDGYKFKHHVDRVVSG
jgi:hypothetical protein